MELTQKNFKNKMEKLNVREIKDALNCMPIGFPISGDDLEQIFSQEEKSES